MGKYGARKTVIDGRTFDSSGEARRYADLRLLERAGQIRDLQCQPKYVLAPASRRNGKAIRAVTYTADFAYLEGAHSVVEDFKGHETEGFKIRERLFLAAFPTLLFRVTDRNGVRREWLPD